MQQCTEDEGVVGSEYGRNRIRLSKCSLVYYASLAIGIDPADVHCPVAGVFQARRLSAYSCRTGFHDRDMLSTEVFNIIFMKFPVS